MKQISRFLLAITAVLCFGFAAKATGWPANYQGVMLQGFYWNSYDETSWSNLEANADEYSKYFSLIWVPNSAKAEGRPSMGYHPIYWFTNHNSSFGTETELRLMIATYKAKGTGIIADVVINHRSGVSNWTDFPAEIWNGTTYKIGPEGICKNDEVAGQSGQAQPTGNYDTGENWSGARDLDHTNANVQNNCKAYVKCLLTDYGYAGVRYDFVKGYSPAYTKMYNQANNVKFSVGEYWDGSYDKVKDWIEGTGKESAAFDFPFKYAVNEAFASNDMTKLVWKANGTTNQPAGMIHFGYPQYAVTLIDNHDTYRDGSKFNGNVVAANAFMLMSPGTPCVFLPHYLQHKAAIQTLINIRNACGITNTSAVTVLKTANNCYMAEIKGSKGTAVVKIGSSMDSPQGYSDSDIKASGTDYCVWTKTGGIVTPDPVPVPAPARLYVMGSLKQGSWKTNVGVEMTKSGNKFVAKDVELVADPNETNAFFSFVTTLGTTGDTKEWDAIINASDRYGATSKDAPLSTSADIQLFAAGVDASSAYSWSVAPGKYTITADFDKMTVSISDGDVTPIPDPETVTVYWDNSTARWATPHIHYWGASESTWPGNAMTLVKGRIWKYVCPAGTTGILFNAGDGKPSQTGDFTAVNNHVYTAAGDQGEYKEGGDTGDAPAKLYVLGNLKQGSWKTNIGVELTKSGSTFVAKDVELVAADGGTDAYFSFVTVLGTTGDATEWDDIINGSDRYGAATKDERITADTPATLRKFAVGVDASSAYSWSVKPGTYTITANFTDNTVTVSGKSGIDDVEIEDAAAPVYYNLQGVRVEAPAQGIFIEVRGNKARKVVF